MPKIMLNSVEYTGGGGDSGMELTYDEYLALPEEEKTNGTTYYVKDINGIGKDQFQPIIYSEEEREIGVWTDGKPLYQKTIIINSIISGNNTINHEIDNVDKIVHCIGIFFSNVGNSVSIPNGNLSSTWSISMYDFGVTNFKLSVGSDWIQYFDHICVTIQYTKTTDQPGSGTWTPQGVPAVHYDGNEKVVGTWFGETLYEKTYVGTISNYDSSIDGYLISADIDVTTIKELINIDGSLRSIDPTPAFASLNGLKNSPSWSADVHINQYGILLWTGNSSYGSKFAGGKAVVTIRYTKTTS